MFTTDKKDITLELAIEAVNYNETEHERLQKLEDYYLGKHDILSRTKTVGNKNNKVVVNHAKYITDVNVGYLLGNPIDYALEDKKANVELLQPIKDVYKQQNIANLDVAIAKGVSMFGRYIEYVYVDGNIPMSTGVSPRTCVVAYDDTVKHNKLFAVMYRVGEKKGEYEYLQIITQYDITTYRWNKDIKKLVLADAPVKHFFGVVPVIEYSNNEEQQGDYEQALGLIDAYNVLQSDRVNDKEQLVEAFLMLKGFGLTPKQMTSLKINRVLGDVPKDGGDATYVTKQLNEIEVDKLREVLEQDIHKVTMTPNISDQNFIGNSSGVALKYKLLAWEQNTMNKERNMEIGLLERFAIYNSYLVVLSKMQKIEKYQVDAIFKRNLPQNDYETSQMIQNLQGLVSKVTLISQLGFVDDAQEEVEKAEEEEAEKATAGLPQYGDLPNAMPMTEAPPNMAGAVTTNAGTDEYGT